MPRTSQEPSNIMETSETVTEEARSFGDEVKELTAGLGWGVRWLAVSLAWGGSLFAFMGLIIYAVSGGAITNPGPYYGLVVVTGLLTLVLSILRRRV